jgi:hypothetical protein
LKNNPEGQKGIYCCTYVRARGIGYLPGSSSSIVCVCPASAIDAKGDPGRFLWGAACALPHARGPIAFAPIDQLRLSLWPTPEIPLSRCPSGRDDQLLVQSVFMTVRSCPSTRKPGAIGGLWILSVRGRAPRADQPRHCWSGSFSRAPTWLSRFHHHRSQGQPAAGGR